MESTSSEAGGSTREPPPPHQKALWRQLVYNRATRDRAELKFNSAIDWGHKKSIEKLLEQAQVAAGERISPLRWWNGSSQERAWLSLYEAEAEAKAEADEELCNPEPPPPHQKAWWRQLVYNRATRDRAELKFNSAIDWGHKKSIEKLLEQAQVAAGERISPLRWWNGSSQERAWLSLHEAEAEFDEELCNPELEAQAHDLLAKAEHLLKPGDERVKAVSDALAEPRWAPRPRLKPVTVAHLSRAVYDAMDRRFAESLACRNRIIRLTLISLVALGLLMAALATNAIHLGVGTPAPSALEGALLVPLFGAIGALIIAIPPLARVTGSSNPFGLQHYQMLLKVTMGPVFAILGVMLLQSGLIPGVQPATSMRFPDLLVWALVFGATQQVVTRAIDSRVAGLVSDEPTERAVGAPRNLGTAGNLNEDGQADASSKDGS